MRCVIVGDGPSARGFCPPDGVPVIAVKRVVNWISRADYWFSLDPNEASMAAMRNQRPGTVYYCACDDGTVLPPGVIRLRRIARRSSRCYHPRNTPGWWLWRWSAVLGLSHDPGAVSSGNSAYGALGLAYHLGFRDVLLVGVDGTTEERISGGKPNNLSHLPRLFVSALNDVRVRTVGRMAGIETITLEAWVNESPRS